MGKKKAGKEAAGAASGATVGGGDDLDAILAELDAVQTILCAEEVGAARCGSTRSCAARRSQRGQKGGENDAMRERDWRLTGARARSHASSAACGPRRACTPRSPPCPASTAPAGAASSCSSAASTMTAARYAQLLQAVGLTRRRTWRSDGGQPGTMHACVGTLRGSTAFAHAHAQTHARQVGACRMARQNTPPN